MRAAICALATMALFAYSSSAQIINPLLFVNSSYALPMGIASYGLANISSDSGPYVVSTNEVFGYAKIDSMYAQNASAAYQLNISTWGVSLQQNIMLNITVGNTTYAYWLQNVADINTSNSTYYMLNNIWNATSTNAGLLNATLGGRGNVTGTVATLFNPENNTYYSYAAANNTAYSFPFYFEPVIRLGKNGGYPYVQFGYLDNSTTYFYDNVTFLIPNATAELLVTPYNQTGELPNGNFSAQYYDAELVFGGEANGATTTFRNISALLWIGYLNRNGSIVPFPKVATFGFDTEENATNVDIVQGGGFALVETGIDDYNRTIVLSGVPDGIIISPPAAPATVPTTTIINVTGFWNQRPSPSTQTSMSVYAIIIALIALGYAYIKIKERDNMVVRKR